MYASYSPQFWLRLIFEDYITQKRFLIKRERDYVTDWVLTQYLINRDTANRAKDLHNNFT